MTYPPAESMGITTPTRLMTTRGSKQYPSTDALRGYVRELAKVEDDS